MNKNRKFKYLKSKKKEKRVVDTNPEIIVRNPCISVNRKPMRTYK